MLKKTITYENLFTGGTVTEDHYFHISKADLIEMEMEGHGNEYTDKNGEKLTGMQAKLQRIVDSEDGKAIMSEFKDMIRRSYGKKDGDRFLKSKEISDAFLGSEAFSELLFELCTHSGAGAEFMNGIIPGNLDKVAAEVQERAAQIRAEQVASTTSEETPALTKAETALSGDLYELRDEVRVATPENPVALTNIDLVEMPAARLQSGLADGRYKLS